MESTNDINLVEIWLRRDPIRWMAGAAAGVLAGAIMLAFAMVLSLVFGYEVWFAAKLPAIPVLGGEALTIGFHMKAIMTGILIHEGLCLFLGVIYAHMTGTNAIAPLLGVGFTWGCFSWVFMNNLMFQSWREVFAVNIPKGAAFIACLVFGFSLASVSFFDRIFRSKG